jgi:hypothetical protein
VQLHRRARELESRNIATLVVTFEAGPAALAYVRETQLAWPLLVDANRELYKAYGMFHGRWWNLYGPASTWTYLKLMLRGRRPRLPAADPTQLGGDVLIDPGGIVRLHYVGNGPADRPSVQSILDIASSKQSRDQ